MITPRNQMMKIIELTNGFEQPEELPGEEIIRQYAIYSFPRKPLKSRRKNVNLQKN